MFSQIGFDKISKRRLGILVFVFASFIIFGIAGAQTFAGKPLSVSEPIATINLAPIKLHRVIDQENQVACYVLSDGKTAPSCVKLH